MLMHWPKLSAYDLGILRSQGPGLGNLLFPIARALIGQNRYGGTFIYPTMRQVKLGPFLRRERDKRIYGHVLRSRTRAEWYDWYRGKWQDKVSEVDYDDIKLDATICYSGLRHFFYDLEGNRELISSWISENAIKPQDEDCSFDIAIHVRLGDFAPAGSGTGYNTQLSLDWYREAFEEAKRLVGISAPRVVLFTDGDASKVAAGLKISGINIDESENALLSIKRLSQARIIITSRSTFSMWGAYLGGCPAVWDKELNLAEAFPIRLGLDHFI